MPVSYPIHAHPNQEGWHYVVSPATVNKVSRHYAFVGKVVNRRFMLCGVQNVDDDNRPIGDMANAALLLGGAGHGQVKGSAVHFSDSLDGAYLISLSISRCTSI